jgi:putative methyltransferase (TIGR04325 family)
MDKDKIKDLLPPALIRSLTSLFYGWHGNYASWRDAMQNCKGYESQSILEKVKDSALKVKSGSAVYERDSLIFDHIEYSFPLLSGLLFIAGQKNNKLNLLDFGGSLGSSYFQNKYFLDSLEEVNWFVVEQPDFVKTGKELFENKQLHFANSVDECFKDHSIDVVLLSSVLQYLEKPYVLLAEILSKKPEFVIVDRTPFISKPDRITVQKVNPRIYQGSYPCWFFNEEKFVSVFKSNYNMILEFDALDKANIPSKFKGFIFRKNKYL